MAWIARDKDNDLYVFEDKPIRREDNVWVPPYKSACIDSPYIKLPFDADERLIGRHITWEDEPIELK